MVLYKRLILFFVVYVFIESIYPQNTLANTVLDSYMNRRDARTLFQKKFLRNFLQNLFIEEYIIPWMDSHGRRFPKLRDLERGENRINFPLNKLLNKIQKGVIHLGLFDSKRDLVNQVIQKTIEQGTYNFYSFPEVNPNPEIEHNISIQYINSISSEDLKDPEKRSKIQEYFIINIIFPWLSSHNSTFPKEREYKKTILGVSYTKSFNHPTPGGYIDLGIFDTPKDLKDKAYLLDKDHEFVPPYPKEEPQYNEHINYINSTTQIDLRNPEKRAEIQKYFIINILFPWMLTHGGDFPKQKEFRKDVIGVTYARVYGLKTSRNTYHVGIFNSSIDLKNKALELAQNTPGISISCLSITKKKSCFAINLDKLDFNKHYEVSKLQHRFVVLYLLPWMNKFKRFPSKYDFGTSNTQVGIAYTQIFDTIQNDTSNPHLFHSLEDLRLFTISLIKEHIIDPFYSRYLSEPCSSWFLNNNDNNYSNYYDNI